MSQSEPPLGAFFVDIVAPTHMESPFRCLAELADRAFTLADQHAGPDLTNVPPGLKTRHASILYPVGGSDVEPIPIKAVLHQNTPAMQIQQVIINFETKTVECEGQPNLPIEPEQIEHAQEEIKPYLQDVWKKKRAREKVRKLQEDLAWRVRSPSVILDILLTNVRISLNVSNFTAFWPNHAQTMILASTDGAPYARRRRRRARRATSSCA